MLNIKSLGKIVGPVGALLIVASAATWMFVTAELNWHVYVPFAIGVVCIGLFVYAKGREMANRGSAFDLISLVAATVLAVGLGVVDVVSVKKDKSWDMTKAGIFTLADQTRAQLQGLQTPVKVTAFYRSDEPGYEELSSLLARYKELAGEKLTYEFVDMYKNPERVQSSNITQQGPRIVVAAGGREARAKEPGEEQLTNAIAEVTGGAAKTVYFIEGHGEKSIDEAAERGLKNLADGLKTEGYKVEKVNLLGVAQVPVDAAVLVIAGPVSPLLEKEVETIKGWVEKGGKLLALLDPSVQSGLEAVLKGWGVEIKNDTIIDTESQYWQWAVAQKYEQHPITQPRQSPFALAAVFPLARGVSKVDAAGYTVSALAYTGERAWGETGAIVEGGKVAFDKGVDNQGPVSIAVASSKAVGADELRVAVFGDSDFASNANLRILGNRDLALNAVAWLSRQETKISIRPKQRDASRLFLTREQKQNIAFGSFIMLPVLLLGAGLVVREIRKNK